MWFVALSLSIGRSKAGAIILYDYFTSCGRFASSDGDAKGSGLWVHTMLDGILYNWLER